jgi:GrpB-like predicted nucleotidyltransferase (UPF0157 family)
MEVGSTALAGVVGKQDLDFVVRVPSSRFEHSRIALDAQFPRNQRQLCEHGFQGYCVPSQLEAAIQLIVAGSQHDNFERFLNCLTASTELRQAYNALKIAFDGRPMHEYRLAKSAFIEAALKGQP